VGLHVHKETEAGKKNHHTKLIEHTGIRKCIKNKMANLIIAERENLEFKTKRNGFFYTMDGYFTSDSKHC